MINVDDLKCIICGTRLKGKQKKFCSDKCRNKQVSINANRRFCRMCGKRCTGRICRECTKRKGTNLAVRTNARKKRLNGRQNPY